MRVTLASPTRRLLSLATLLVLLSCVASKAQSPPLPLLPNGVAYDAAGNLYFSDTNRHQVYESSLSGVLTVVAGSGIQGFAGDGGPATSAQLNSPQGIAIGPDGTLYIADTGNQRIRTVIAGQIATFAGNGTAGFAGDGGAALSASLHTPTALALDATGALLVCDTANHRVRRISAGQIATIVGSGVQGFAGDGAAAMAAQLDTPSGIAVGPNGRLYIADTHNSRIRVIAANGTIATFAGNGIRSYFGDGGQATAAGLSLPRGLAITTAGTLLFADSDNQRVRMVDAQGTITTIAGTGVQGSSVDGSPAATAALDTPRTVSVSTFGSPVLADAGNHQIRESLDNTTLYLPAGLASGRTSTISLTANPNANTNQAIASVSVLGSAGTPQGSVSLFDGTTLVGQASLTTGTANFPLGSLANGSHALSATYVGDGVNPAATSNIVTINIGALTVTATANSQTMEYGQPIPVLTGTLSGVLPQDIGNVNVIFSTSATSLSVPGSYAITAVLTGSASSNYTLSLSPSSGSLLISQADSLTVEQPLTQSSYAGLPLVLTASVASTTQGTPTGTVSFSDGSSLIATAALSGGIASATYLSPPAGTVSITASYAGDKNFKPSSSQRMTATVSAMPDFTVSASTTTQTIAAGGVASYAMTVAAQPAPFTGVVYLSASNLPAGATATFSPPQSVPGMGSAAVTMSVQTSTAQGERVDHTGALLTTCLLLPVSMFLFRRRTLRRIAPASAVVLILLNTLGCGARSITTDALSKQVYAFQVTGTSTNLAGSVIAHSLTVTLIVQ